VRLTTNPACQEHSLSACVNLSDNDVLSQRMIRLGMVKTCISVVSDANYGACVTAVVCRFSRLLQAPPPLCVKPPRRF
jgi:hypothetical protein